MGCYPVLMSERAAVRMCDTTSLANIAKNGDKDAPHVLVKSGRVECMCAAVGAIVSSGRTRASLELKSANASAQSGLTCVILVTHPLIHMQILIFTSRTNSIYKSLPLSHCDMLFPCIRGNAHMHAACTPCTSLASHHPWLRLSIPIQRRSDTHTL